MARTRSSVMEYALEVIGAVASWDEAVSVGIDLSSYGSEAHWMLGDLALRVVTLKPEDPLLDQKVRTLKTFSGAIKQSYEVVKDATRTARFVPPDLRAEYPMLYFGHWREIIRRGLRGPDMVAWASRAAENGWTATHLAKELRGSKPIDESMQDQKLLRRIVGIVGDLDTLDLGECWRQYADDVLDAQRALEAGAAKLSKARQGIMDEKALGLQSKLEGIVPTVALILDE